jgi:hypothetical protein
MVLLFNVYITKVPGNQFQTHIRGNLKQESKLDVLKYSLASLSVAYPWSKAIINIELDTEYTVEDSDSLKNYVQDLFKDYDLVYSTKRCEQQKDWQALYELFNDELILYLGNHDHVFIDSSQEYLKELVETVKNNYPINGTIAFSHWPENVRWAKCGYIELNQLTPHAPFENYSIESNHLHFQTTTVDSILVITKTIYHNWFFTGEWGDLRLPRTDGVGGVSLPLIRNTLRIPLPKQDILVPLKELFRHFDGYSHQRIGNDICPSLEIPYGFFDNSIKIRYGYDDRKDGWTNFNPKQTYYAYDKAGTDYRWTLEDIPLFWKKAVVDIDINPYIDEMDLIQHRLLAILNMVYSDERYNPHIDPEVQQIVLNQHLQAYENYKLT